MQKIPFDDICRELTRILLDLGFEKVKAKRCAHIFTENTCDGVASHGLNRFPGFVEDVKSGVIDIYAESQRVSSLGVMEQWDGMRGLGPLNAEKAMGRAVELAAKHGLACVGLRNTNHWMRGGTYGLQAADAGCIGICWTNTTALMPAWGSSEKKIGNNPLVIGIPRSEGHILLDMAMSQFSNGKLEVLRRRGEQLPLVGGFNQNGELTTDPNAILESSRALPIGYWKGSGLALSLDLMASLIAAGDATTDISQRDKETGVSQVFFAINVHSHMSSSDVDAKVNIIIEDFLNCTSLTESTKLRYPGQGMFAARKKNLETGIPVERELWQTIQNL